MLKDRIYVIHSGSTIETMYTLFPLIVSRFNHLMVYIHVDSREVNIISGGCVILIRVFKGNRSLASNNQKKRDYIENLRKRFDRIIMLDDGAGSDSLHFEYMDLVDLYYKGKLLRDRTNYLRPMYGRQLFTDYYHKRYDIVDANEKVREIPDDPDLLKRLRVSWNLGYGMFPMPGKKLVGLAKTAAKIGFSKSLRPWFLYSYRKMIETLSRPVETSTKLNKVQARFGNNVLPETVAFQRRLFLESCVNNEFVLSGKINSKLYNREIRKVASVLSPFGWGEVCFRDFETILNGALLIKPDMSHLETWPDVYLNSKTYLPVDWDGINLDEIINSVSNHKANYASIAEGGRLAYKNALLELDNRVYMFLREAAGTNSLNATYDKFFLEQHVI
ncbi:hypothetical protein ACX0G7_05800 [Flavitalea antarctica]